MEGWEYLAGVLRGLGAQVPEAQGGVARPTGQLLAAGAEGHRQHRFRMPCSHTCKSFGSKYMVSEKGPDLNS